MNVRLDVKKTYKLFIGGAFPRTESGRYDPLRSPGGTLLANVSRASRKDLRNAVVAARKAFPAWSSATPYLRGQILYRAAELLEGRRAQFAAELEAVGAGPAEAADEVATAVDLLVAYAGWTDKYAQVFGAVNPVASPHFCFSLPEPSGVVAAIAPEDGGLLALVATLAPLAAGGNTCVVLAPVRAPLCAISFAEVLQGADLPGGAVNLLTGRRAELLPHMASHRDIDGLLLHGADRKERAAVQAAAADSLKRLAFRGGADGDESPFPTRADPYAILDFQEIKTTWHPVGM